MPANLSCRPMISTDHQRRRLPVAGAKLVGHTHSARSDHHQIQPNISIAFCSSYSSGSTEQGMKKMLIKEISCGP
jgi:hypothetical protein